jgi:hypothetical protein
VAGAVVPLAFADVVGKQAMAAMVSDAASWISCFTSSLRRLLVFS